ncbi:MAG: NAD-dependent epimerase/dehydratase family protein [Victivallaceae bacterium]|nr:GDP-mannose 4,6-dehydratase [Victivallaceae bacterium]
MRFLITGGAGFIGSHLAEKLLASPENSVTAVDNFSTGSRGNLINLEPNPRFTLIEGDILTLDSLESLIAEADVVYHLAAAVGVELVVHDPVHTLATNVHGSSRVLEFAAAHRRRTIIASSSEVYGKSRKTSFEETDDLIIGAPTRSRWSYACSKLIDEFFLMAYVRNCDFPGTVVRFFNTVGPRQIGQYGMVVPRFVSAALAGEPLKVFGTGHQSRCFCHVYDTVRALTGLADCPASHGEIYNIGSQESVSMLELAGIVISQLGSSSKIEMVPYDVAYQKGFEDMLRRLPETAKIRELLGWRPEHNLAQIINDVADCIRGNRSTC